MEGGEELRRAWGNVQTSDVAAAELVEVSAEAINLTTAVLLLLPPPSSAATMVVEDTILC